VISDYEIAGRQTEDIVREFFPQETSTTALPSSRSSKMPYIKTHDCPKDIICLICREEADYLLGCPTPEADSRSSLSIDPPFGVETTSEEPFANAPSKLLGTGVGPFLRHVRKNVRPKSVKKYTKKTHVPATVVSEEGVDDRGQQYTVREMTIFEGMSPVISVISEEIQDANGHVWRIRNRTVVQN
jgi:hypothetical protein